MSEHDTPKRQGDEDLPTPKKVGEPGRTPGTAEGGQLDERRHNPNEPGHTPGTAESGGLDGVGPARH